MSLNRSTDWSPTFSPNGAYILGHNRTTLSLNRSTDYIPIFYPNGAYILGHNRTPLSLNRSNNLIPIFDSNGPPSFFFRGGDIESYPLQAFVKFCCLFFSTVACCTFCVIESLAMVSGCPLPSRHAVSLARISRRIRPAPVCPRIATFHWPTHTYVLKPWRFYFIGPAAPRAPLEWWHLIGQNTCVP